MAKKNNTWWHLVEVNGLQNLMGIYTTYFGGGFKVFRFKGIKKPSKLHGDFKSSNGHYHLRSFRVSQISAAKSSTQT